MLKQFSREQVSKILKIKNGRLKYWDRLNLVKPSLRQGGKVFYDFQDLICLRTVKNIIEKGVAATHLNRSVAVLIKRFPQKEYQLSNLRVFALGERIIASKGNQLLDSLSGQYLLALDWDSVRSEVRERVDLFAGTREADEWYKEGLNYDLDPSTHERALHAYRQAIKLDPSHENAFINLGILYYRRRNYNQAERSYKKALEINPSNPVTLFQLGLVSEENNHKKKAFDYYERALSKKYSFPEAHYQLAGLAEKLNHLEKAIIHWKAYLEFDKTTLHGRIAHKRIQVLNTRISGD